MKFVSGLLVSIGLWSICCPAPAEVSLESCAAAAHYSAARRGFSLLVIRNDRVFFEYYANGGGVDVPESIFSGTKGFWCVSAVAAEQDGILSLDEPVRDTITEWQRDPTKADIRIRNLLNFTAGIEPAFILHGRSIPSRNLYAINLRPVADPGQTFMYGPSELQIFSEVLRRKLARYRLTPEQYLSRRLLHPLGIYFVDFREDAAGNPLLAAGFRLTARQWAQFGLLLLHNGAYGGRQIVSPNRLQECFSPSRANPMFGMGFWLNRLAFVPLARECDVENMLELPWQVQHWQMSCLCRDAPRDMISSIGSGYNRMFIFPSQNMIVVRQGRNAPFSDAHFLRIILGRET